MRWYCLRTVWKSRFPLGFVLIQGQRWSSVPLHCLSLPRCATRGLLEEAARICRELDIPIRGVITDGQRSIRNAVVSAIPDIPHQLCQFHYLREAAKPIAAADLHAKKELKKQVSGVRPLERTLEGRTDTEAETVRGYCLAVRSALTDDGKPPLDADGLQLEERLRAIDNSIRRVAEKRGFPTN